MTNNHKAAIYNFVLRAGIGAGIALAYLHISLAPFSQSITQAIVDLDRYLFPVSLAKQYSFLASWRLPEREIRLPAAKKTPKASGYWLPSDAPEYKNERLSLYQDLLKERGITDPKHLKLFVAQILQENGALSEDVDGDHGCSIGIPQRNVCLFRDPVTKKKFTAKTFRDRYPEWRDWRTQLNWLADSAAKTYSRYDKNVFQAITHHNCPACAQAAVDACYVGGKRLAKCYYQQIVSRSATLTSL